MDSQSSGNFDDMEDKLVTSVLLDSKVFKSLALAYPKVLWCKDFRKSFRSLQGKNSNSLAFDHA